MRLVAACSSLFLLAAGAAIAVSASEDEKGPLRKRIPREDAVSNNNYAPPQEATAAVGTADAPVAASVGDATSSGAYSSAEEEDIRLLRLDDAVYWKKFMDKDTSVSSDDMDKTPMPSSAPTESDDGDCTFDVDINCKVKFNGGSKFRDCEESFGCTDDMTEQTFEYLGGDCASDRADAGNYKCRTYENGPGDQKVRLLVVIGDFYDDLKESEDTNTYGKAKEFIEDEIDDDISIVRLFDGVVSPKDMYMLVNLGDRLGLPDNVDSSKLTYVVYEDKGDDGEHLVKARWEYKCEGSDEGQYGIYANFANSELIGFESEDYGMVMPTSNAQAEFTIDLKNECNADGAVVELDRRLCKRGIGDTGYECEPMSSALACVKNGVLSPTNCEASVTPNPEGLLVVKKDEEITFTDNEFTTLNFLEPTEYQYRVPVATISFHGRGTVTNLNTREEFFFGGNNNMPPLPPDIDCPNFDITDIECEINFKDTNTNNYRPCEEIWECTDDMIQQTFEYLGGDCASGSDRGDPVGYRCDEVNGGPGNGERRVEMLLGEWYDTVKEGDEDDKTYEDVRDEIESELRQIDDNLRYENVRLLNEENFEATPGTTINPRPFLKPVSPPPPSTNPNAFNPNFVTFLVFRNDGGQGGRTLRLVSSWQWACSPGSGFLPASEYSVWDNFATLELTSFVSSQYGTVQLDDNARARFKYTIENKCEVAARIQKLDREVCARNCDSDSESDWTCPDKDGINPYECVINGVLQPNCEGDVIIASESETTITDNYKDSILARPTLEYRVQLRDTTVQYVASASSSEFNGEIQMDDDEKEFFDLCADDDSAD